MVAIKPQPRPTQPTTESPSTFIRSSARPPPSSSAPPIPSFSSQNSQPYDVLSTIRQGQTVPQSTISPAPTPTSQTTSTAHTPLALKWILILPATLLLVAFVLLCLFILDRNRREKRRRVEKLIHNPTHNESEQGCSNEMIGGTEWVGQCEKLIWGPVGRKTMIFGTTQARKKRSPPTSPSPPTYSPHSRVSSFPPPTFANAQIHLDHDHEKIGNSNLNAGMAFIPLADPCGNSIRRDSLIISPSPFLPVPRPCALPTTRRRLDMDGPYPSLTLPSVPLINERRGSYKGLASLPFVLHEAKSGSASPSPSSSRPLASPSTPLRTPTRQEIQTVPTTTPTLRPAYIEQGDSDQTPSIALQRATATFPASSPCDNTVEDKMEYQGVDVEVGEREVDGEKQRTDRGRALKTLIGVDNFTSPPTPSFRPSLAAVFHFGKTSNSACTLASTSSAYSNSSYSSPSPSPFLPRTRTAPHVAPIIANKMNMTFTALSRPPSAYATQPPRNRRKIERFGQRGMAGMAYVPQKELGVVYECDSDFFGGGRQGERRDVDEGDEEEESKEEDEHVSVDDQDPITDVDVSPIPITQEADLTPSPTRTTLEELPPPQPAFHHAIPTYATASTIHTHGSSTWSAYDSGVVTAYEYDGDLSCSSSLSTAYSIGTIDEPRRSVWMSERDWVEGPVAF